MKLDNILDVKKSCLWNKRVNKMNRLTVCLYVRIIERMNWVKKNWKDNKNDDMGFSLVEKGVWHKYPVTGNTW